MTADPVEGRVSRLLPLVAKELQVAPVPYGGAATTLASDYWLWTHKIYVSPQLADKLTDLQLACLLAHELGHANTRGRLILSTLAGLAIRIGLPLLTLLALGAGGLIVGSITGLAAWLGFKKADLRLRLWEEAPADDFGVTYAGKAEYKAALQEVVEALKWRPDALFHQRLARLA